MLAYLPHTMVAVKVRPIVAINCCDAHHNRISLTLSYICTRSFFNDADELIMPPTTSSSGTTLRSRSISSFTPFTLSLYLLAMSHAKVH